MNMQNIDNMKRWMTLKEAADYTSIGRNRLVVMARERRIKGFQDLDTKTNEWIFDRISLDAYREQQCISITIQDRVLAIAKGVGL